MPYDFIGDVDIKQVVFGPFTTVDQKQRVDVFRDATSKKLLFNLCPNAETLFDSRYRLDTPAEGSDGSRRGLTVALNDERARQSLQMLDDRIVETAVANSKEWFKKKLSEVEVRARYKPLVFRANDDDLFACTKFKVKCAKFPTKLHLTLPDGVRVPEGGSLDDLGQRNVKVAPILSIFGLWFMGGGSTFGVSMQAEEILILRGDTENPMSNFNFTAPVVFRQMTTHVETGGEETTDPPAKRVKTEDAIEQGVVLDE